MAARGARFHVPENIEHGSTKTMHIDNRDVSHFVTQPGRFKNGSCAELFAKIVHVSNFQMALNQ